MSEKMLDEVFKYYEDDDLTLKQRNAMRAELEQVCQYFYDGFDRALALESSYHWGGITAELVNILHMEV